MSDDSDIQSKTGQRRKRPVNAASSSESSESGCPSATSKRSRKLLDVSSNSEDTDSEIDSEFISNLRSKKSVKQILASNEDSREEDSSDEEEDDFIQPVRRHGPPKILSDHESGDSIDEDEGILTNSSSPPSSDSEDTNDQPTTTKTNLDALSAESSSDFDGEAEKCPICLARFSNQEIGSPESCDHCFCAVCIQEWAKNVNTCPVDRQPFTLILVRQHLEGKVIRQVPVNPPSENQVDPLEDATFCEVCGQSDREDRMLLCDSCDHGYHMDCLMPPLLVVPIEEWYCPECAPHHHMRQPGGVRGRRRRQAGADVDEVGGAQHRPQLRLLPRTMQSERVRTSLRNRDGIANVQASTSSGVESMETENTQVRQRQQRQQRRRRPRTRRQPKTRVKRIVTDDGVIEVLVKCKKRKKYKKKRKNRTLKTTSRTVKGRLASRLGMCKPRMTKQTIPETFNRQEINTTGINHQRHQAGVPTLDIFGRRNQLDSFSGSDGEEEDLGNGGTGVLSRVRVARPSDRLISHKKAASILSLPTLRTPLKVEDIPAPAGGGLLDSILDSQKLWHSKKTEIKSNSDGSLQVILPKSSKDFPKESSKVDVKSATGPVKETPMFPGGRMNAGGYRPENQNTGAGSQGSRSTSERIFEESSFQSLGPGPAGGYQRYENNVGPTGSPLRGLAPIRFRMNLPPRRPNIHSYPSDNIPPPPPLRLRSPLVEVSFPATNSPEASPTREEEEIDIYSDIEQENTTAETEDKTFGALEPPPEPPFLMTMEPPPEPPAILMNLNDDASDDEPSGLVIDDLPAADVYDPCAANSDDSSAGDAPLSKPPEVPSALKDRELVADYSSDSAGTTSYNPELPTYSSTPIFGPLPRPPSHNSSDDNDNDEDEECPNFSMYSAASMNLAHRGLSGSLVDLDIPIPPPIEKEHFNIPLPDEDSRNISDKEEKFDIPIPKGENVDPIKEDENMSDGAESQCEEEKDLVEKIEEKLETIELEKHEKKSSIQGDTEEEGGEDEDDDGDEGDDEEGEADNDRNENASDGESSVPGDAEKVAKNKIIKTKTSSEAGEDECSTQGDVLDLAIESEANLENNTQHEEVEEQHEMVLAKSPVGQDENDEKMGDGGDKSDGLVDITDEEMSVYDGQDNGDDIEKLDENVRLDTGGKEKHFHKSLDSDDDNSLVGGATSAVSGGTLNNSDNIPPPTLPGLEGLETETISESEDVNFDELPLEENNTQLKGLVSEDDHSSSRKKKKKKYRKASHCEENSGKGNSEQLEFEEGEIIDDKPKQISKKDKKVKPKSDNTGILDDNVDSIQAITPTVEKDVVEKKTKKKKEKASTVKDKNDKNKEPKEKTLKPGHTDENISWKKLSKSTKERNYRDGKEKDEKEKDRDRENKDEGLSRKEKRNKEKRKELERYDVRRLISEKPKRPKKDEFGRDISPSKSGSSLSPYRPRFRSPLRTRNRSRTKSRSRSKSRGRRRRSRSRDKNRSRDRSRRSRSRDKGRSRSRKRSRSRNKVRSRSREKRKTPDRVDKGERARIGNRSLSKTRRKTRSPSVHSRRHRSLSYSRSWTPSWSKSSISRSRSPKGRRRTRSVSRSKSGSWTREQNVPLSRGARTKEPPKNLTVIVTNKDALKKKDKKKPNKKKDDRRKKKRGQSPAPSKEVFTSGDNILVSVNFKNANKNPELIPATTPILRESSKRKRDDLESSAKKKKPNSSSKKTPGAKKSSRLAKINEATRNAKPVAIIDLDLSPFREQTPSPKEIIVLTDSENEGDKERSERQDDMDRMGHNGLNQSMLSLSSNDHGQKNSMSQPESPISSNFMLNSSGPKTPPEPHIKFSISTKPSQVRMLSNPLMEQEEEMQDENIENEGSEILHKGPNTPPEPPPDLNTPASPPTTPYDPFDPTKSRSPSPQPRSNDTNSQLNTSREDKLDNMQSEESDHPHMAELRISTPPNESEDLRKTPEPVKVHSTPKTDPNNTDASPKVSPQTGTVEQSKLSEDTLLKPIQKLLAGANKLDVTVHKSPEKLITVVISQQVKNLNQTPKQTIQPLKPLTPSKHQTPKSTTKHQLFSSSLVKQVPILGTLPLLSGAPVYTPSVGMNSSSKNVGRVQNGDQNDDMDIDPSSPYSPGSSEGDDLFEPPIATPPRNPSSKSITKPKPSGNKFDSLFGSSPAKLRHGRHLTKSSKKIGKPKSKGNKKEEVKVKLDEDQLKILDELPSSAVEMQVKDKFLKKLNRQERVVEEVKLVLKPHYAKKHVNKEEYKEILRRSVPKICHNKSGEINPIKIQFLVEAYVKKFRYAKKKASGTLPAPTQNKPKPQKALWS